jgi:hypothetical protein
MVKGEFKDPEIVVVDIGSPARDIDLRTRQQPLRRSNNGYPHISEKYDRKTFGLPGAKKIGFGQIHGIVM